MVLMKGMTWTERWLQSQCGIELGVVEGEGMPTQWIWVWDVCCQLHPRFTAFSMGSHHRWEVGNDILHSPLPTGEFRWCQWEALVQEVESGRDTPRSSSGVSGCMQMWGSHWLPGKLLKLGLFSKAGGWARWHSGYPKISGWQDFLKVSSWFSQPWLP